MGKERDIYTELRVIGLTSEQCSDVLDLIGTLPIEIKEGVNNIKVNISSGVITIEPNLSNDNEDIFERCFEVVKRFIYDVNLNDEIHDYLLSEIDFVEIIMELEKEFDCTIEEGEIGVENFETVNDMVKWMSLQIK